MDLSPIEKWFHYSEDFYRKMDQKCKINEEKGCISLENEALVEVWSDELYRGLTEVLKNSAPPEEVEEWYAYIVNEGKANEINYNFEVIMKNYSFLFSISKDNSGWTPCMSINIYMKKKVALRYSLNLDGCTKEACIFLKNMSEEIKKVYLNRKSVRLKHLVNDMQILTDIKFEYLYKRKMNE